MILLVYSFPDLYRIKYGVCLYAIKRTLGLYGLTIHHMILLVYSFPDMYRIKYGVASIHQSKNRGFQEPGYKDEPIVISLDNVSIQKMSFPLN